MARHTLSYIQEIGSGWFGKVHALLFTVHTVGCVCVSEVCLPLESAAQPFQTPPRETQFL